AATSPAVTQNGGTPGPPGLSASRLSGDSRGSTRSGSCSPASSRNRPGSSTRPASHGSSSATGTPSASATGTHTRSTTIAATPRTSAATYTRGTNAVATASSRPNPQAARRDLRRSPNSRWPPSTTAGGSSTNTTAVPSRPAATAPVATGSSAYVAAIHTRTPTPDAGGGSSVRRRLPRSSTAGAASARRRLLRSSTRSSMTGAGRFARPRVARYADAPASGTAPSSSTDTAVQVCPSVIVDRAATTATYGGAHSPPV